MSGVPYSSNLPPAKMNQTPDEILADGNPLITGQALLDSADIAVFASTHNDGYHKLPPSGKLIHEHLGSGNIAEIKLSASGYLRTNTIEAGKDDDVTSFLGKAAIGFTGNTVNNGEASFSHLNQQGYTGHSTFAIKQTFDGATSVNSVSGKDTSFEINNLAQMTLCGQTNKVGFLGINQTNPTERVEVVGNIKVTGKIINDEYTTPDNTNLIFYTGAATPVSRLKIIGDTNSSAVGYVAIGPDDPTEKLHVDGNIKVEGTGAGNITASGDISATGDVTGANITTLVSGIGDRAQELLDAGLSSVTAGVTTTPYPFGSGHAADTVWASICHTWNAMTLLNGNIGGASLYTYPWTRTSNTVWESISLAGSMITAIQSPGRLYASSYDLGTNLGPTVWAIAGDTTAYSTIYGTGAITLSSGVTVKYLNGIPMWFFGGRDENVDIMSTMSTGNTWTIAIAIAKKPESKGVLFNQLKEGETNATNHYIQWDGQLSGDEYGNTGNGWTVSAPISIPDESVIVIRKSGTGVDQVEVSLNGGLIGKSQNNETFSGAVNRIRLGQRGRYTNYGDNTPLYMGIAAVAAWQTVLNDTLVSKYLTYQSLTTKA